MLIIFDLDGTIIESGEGIINSFKYTFEKMGIEVPPESELQTYIGPPLDDTFKTKFDFDEEKADIALQYYREFYAKKGKFQARAYDGVLDLIRELKEEHTLAVGTSKLEESARDILRHLEVADCFKFIGGAAKDKSRNTKASVLKHVLEQVEEHDEVYMVGDRFYDVEGAKEFSLNTIGVTWGYGSEEELIAAGADYTVKDAQELRELIDRLSR